MSFDTKNSEIVDIGQCKRLEPVNPKYLNSMEKAIFTGDNRKVKSLYKEDVNKLNSKYGFSSFHYAVELGSLTIVRELTTTFDECPKRKTWADLELKDAKGRNPLMIAIINGHLDIMEFLLIECKVQTNQKDDFGHSALNFAIFNQNLTAITALINGGEDINSVDKSGKYLIHYVILYKGISILKCLLDYGINVNVEDSQKRSPLHYATIEKNQEMIDLILNGGAKIDSRDCFGRVPQDYFNFPTIKILSAQNTNVFSDDELSDIVSFNTENTSDIRSQIFDNKGVREDDGMSVERLGIPLREISEIPEIPDYISDIEKDSIDGSDSQICQDEDEILIDSNGPGSFSFPDKHSNFTMDTSFYSADKLTTTSDYLQMNPPIVRQNSQTQTENTSSLHQFPEYLAKIQFLEHQIEKEQIVREDLIQEKDELAKKVSEFQESLITVKSESNLSDLASAQGGTLRLAKNEIIHLKEELEKYLQTNDQLESDLVRALEEKEILSYNMSDLSNQVNECRTKIIQLKNSNMEITAQYNQDSLEFDKKINDLIQDKESVKCEYKKEIESLLANMNRLTEAGKNNTDAKKTNADMASMVIDLQNSLDLSNLENQDHQNLVQELRAEIKNVTISNRQLQDKWMHESALAEANRNEIQKLSINNERQIIEIDNLRKEMQNAIEGKESSLSLELAQLQNRLNESEVEKSQIEKVLHDLKDEQSSATLSNRKEIDTLLVTNEKYRQDLENMRLELIQSRKEKEMNENFQLEFQKIQVSNSENIKEIDRLCLELKNVKQERDSNMNNLTAKERSQTELLRGEIERLQNCNECYAIDIDKLKLELKKFTIEKEVHAAAETMIIQQEIRMKQSKEEIRKLENTVLQLTTEKDKLDESYKQLKKHYNIQAESYQQELKQLQLEINCLNLQVNQAKHDQAHSETMIKHLEATLNLSDEEIKDLLDMVNQLLSKTNNLSSSHQLLFEKATKDTKLNASYQNEIEKLQNSNDTLKKEIDALRNKIIKDRENKTTSKDKDTLISNFSSTEQLNSLVQDTLLANELSEFKQIHLKQLGEIQRLRSDLLGSLIANPINHDLTETQEHTIFDQATNLKFPFIKASERYDKINVNLLSPKVALIYQRRKLD